MIIAIASQKGGTGKTTSVVNIGACLSKLNKSVLLIDLDPQANLTQSLGIEQELTIEELLTGKAKLEEVITQVENFDVIPCNTYFNETAIGNAMLLTNALKSVYEYDYILIDCPPHLGILTLNALIAADKLFTTIKCDYLSLLSIVKLEDLITEIKQHNPGLELSGIIPTFYFSNTLLSRDTLKRLKDRYKDKVFDPVRINVSLAEAPISHRPVINYAPGSHGAKDYMKIAKQIIKRIK